jgi:hypothetical protein
MASVLTPPAPITQPKESIPQPTPTDQLAPPPAVPALAATEAALYEGDLWAFAFWLFCFVGLGLMNVVDLVYGLLFR